MERRTSLGGHLSLSTSNIASPLAESTHINGSSLQTKFPWGGKMSPAKSVTSNNSVSVIQKSTMPKVAVSPIRKIDPRIYTDVQSNGLTSRIVKYHENSSKLNRSMSVGNLYSKPGQFPVVHLKKTEMQVKPVRNPSISVVRIAPPDKTLYQPSARSSILRTGSILPTIALAKTEERESRDNRPILPPAENDVNPTRSVLDALKEISRKRINSEDVDCNDSIKKYCKETEEDPRHRLRLPLTNVPPTQSQQVSVITKRQREVPPSPESKTSSPENNAAGKKRMCTKNNDISSSLSSSLLINTPKRKLQDIQGRPPIGRHSPSSSNLAPPRAKQHCNDRNYVIAGGSVVDGAYEYPPDQLTPIPPTPAVEPPRQEKVKPVPAESKPVQAAPQKPKLTLFDKDYDTTPIIRRDNDEVRQPEEEGIAGISFIKPKKSSPVLKGKNALIERVQTSKLSLMLSCLSGELNDSDDEVDSKPKEVQKEVVAEVSAPTSTAVSSAFSNPTSVASSANAITVISSTSATSATSTTATTPSFSFGQKSSDANNSMPAASKIPESTGTTETSTKPTFSFGTSTSTGKSDNPINDSTKTSTTPSLNFAAPTSTNTFVTVQQNNSNTSTAPFSTSVTSNPTASTGGFSFGLQKSPASDATTTTTSSTSTVASSIAPVSTTNMFSFGAPKPQQTSTVLGITNSAPNLQTSTAASTPSTTSALLVMANSTPTLGTVATSQNQAKPLFSFGASTTTSSTSTTVTTSSSAPNFAFQTTVSKPLPLFGAALSSSTTTTTGSSFSIQKPNIPTFGSASQPQTTTVFGSASSAFTPSRNTMKSPPKYGESGNTFGVANSGTNSTSGFSFGGSSQPGSTVGTTLFGSAPGSATATTTSSTPTFSFGSSVANKTTSAPSFSFSTPAISTTNAVGIFGAATTTTTTAPSTQTPFAFGASASNNNQVAPTQATPFSFQGAGQQQAQPTNTGFNFSGSTASNAPVFGFGTTAANAAQPETTKSFTFGGGSGTSAFTAVNSSKSASGGFSFNAASPIGPTENKSIFGSNATQPAKPFSFSGATGNKPDQPQSTPVFGSPATATNPPTASFGAPAMTPGKLFSFGGTPANNNAPSANAPSTNLFGTSASNNTTAPLFPAAANITQSPFGAATNTTKPAAPVFNFSSGTNASTNSNAPATGSGAFGFGTAASQPQNATKPFAFGSTAPTAQPTGNIFGSTTTSKAPAFNFSATVASGPADGMNNNNNPLGAVPNPFSPMGSGTDASNIQRREIRTATRRLKPK